MESENGKGPQAFIEFSGKHLAACCAQTDLVILISWRMTRQTAAKTRRNSRHQLTPPSKREPGVVAPSRGLLFLGGNPSCSRAGGSQPDVGLLGQGKTKHTTPAHCCACCAFIFFNDLTLTLKSITQSNTIAMSFFKKLSDLGDDLGRLGLGADKGERKDRNEAQYSRNYEGKWRRPFRPILEDACHQLLTYTLGQARASISTRRLRIMADSQARNRIHHSNPKTTTLKGISQTTLLLLPTSRATPLRLPNRPTIAHPMLDPGRLRVTTRRRTRPSSRLAGTRSGVTFTCDGIVSGFYLGIAEAWKSRSANGALQM